MARIQANQIYHPNKLLKSPGQRQEKVENTSFANQLRQSMKSSVSFSQHAKSRLEQHGISLTESQLQKLNDGVETARQKGSKDSLMLMKDFAFVVSVQNNKVITALKQGSMKDQIVTNIDSALIL